MHIFDACRNGNVNALLAAIERGEDLNTSDENGESPLMFAFGDHLQIMYNV